MAVSLRRKGVSLGASLAFWLGNPTLNPAVLIFILFALSWQWAVLRLVLGLVLVFGVSWLVARWFEGRPNSQQTTVEIDIPASAPPGHWVARWLKSLGRMCVQLIPEYIVIMLLLGAARAWLFPAVGPEIGNSVLLIVGLAIAGALFAIPTAGEIPVIQAMLSAGAAAGPAGVLLMTMAPISLPSVLMLGRDFPRGVLVVVSLAVVALGIMSGLIAALVL